MNDMSPMNDKSQLREQMWDLVYGLLDQDESRELVSRIKSDPQAARLYAEVRLQADLVGYASKVEDSSLVLTGDGAARETVPAAGRSAAAATAAEKTQVLRRSRGGSFLAGIVAAALALLIGIGIFWPEASDEQLAQRFPVIDIQVPRELPGGITSEVDVKIARLDGIGQQAEGEAIVLDAEGQEKYSVRFHTNGIVPAKVKIPGEALQPGVRLKVTAAPVQQVRKELRELTETDKKHEDDQRLTEQVVAKLEAPATSLTAELPVRAEPLLEYYFFAEPPKAGAENKFARWNINAYSATHAKTDMAAAAGENLAGGILAEPKQQNEDGSYFSGYMPAPEATELGSHLAIPDAQDEKSGPTLDGIVLQQEKEGRAYLSRRNKRLDLVMAKGGENRQRYGYFDAGVAAEAPAAAGLETAGGALPGAPPAPGKPGEKQSDAQEQSLAARPAAPTNESPAQQPAPSIAQLAKQEDNAAQERETLAELSKNLEHPAGGEGVTVPKGVTVQLPAEYADRRLTVTATFRGLEVAEKSIDAYESPAKDVADQPVDKAGQSITFELPPEVAGPVTIGLYDSQTNELLEEQVVLREPTRKLNVSVVDGRESYPPGETVSLTLQFTDENGQPAAGAWGGVRVWNEQVVQSYGRRPLLLADALRRVHTDELQDGERALDRAESFSALAAGASLESGKRTRMARENKAAEEKSAIAALDMKKADEVLSPRAEAPQPTLPAPAAPLPEADALPQVAALPDSAAQPDASAAALGSAEFGVQATGEGLSRFYAETAGEGHEYRLETRLGKSPEKTVLASNSAVVRAEYEAAKEKAANDRERARAAIGRVLLFGGIGALVLLGSLALLKLPAKARVVVPSLAVGIASVVLGLGWIGMRPGTDLQQIAMVEDRGDFDHAKSPPAPMATPAPAGPAPTGQALDYLAMDADRSDPAALGGQGGGAGGPGSNNLAFRQGGAESLNAPALAPSDFSDNESVRSQSAAQGSAALSGGAGFGLPARGTAKGPAGRGGADVPRGGESEQKRFSRFKEQAEESLSLKQGVERGESWPRKSAGDAAREGDKPLEEAADGRRGSAPAADRFAKTTPSTTRNFAPGGAPLPAEPSPAPAEATPAPAPETAATPAPANKPAPNRPESPASRSAEDRKDVVLEEAGKSKKESARDKGDDQPLAPGASESDENRAKTDLHDLTKLRTPLTDNLGSTREGFGSGGAPASIYFNPRLIADENGRATIEFTLPPVESEYRLLIDALGNGRIGSLQQRIEVKSAK